MPAQRPPVVLSLAGSDPTGGAGFQLDLRVCTRLGVHGMAVPTALVAQSTEKVHRVLPAFPHVVSEQLAVLLADIVPDAIKIGMLATDDILLAAAHVLEKVDVPRVVDPVLAASDGSVLLERRAYRNLVERFIRGAALVTPNLAEAETLTGETDPEAAGRALVGLGARAALVKGGHARGAPDDWLVTAEGSSRLPGTRRGDGAPVHGTGCALSTAVACHLARGEPLEAAARGAKSFVEAAIAGAYPAGKGQLLLAI